MWELICVWFWLWFVFGFGVDWDLVLAHGFSVDLYFFFGIDLAVV